MAFTGWPAEALDFYEGLAADNSKPYWTEHKATYDEMVYAPMVALLAELPPEFGAGKIFRPYRDVRFSADKTPYKTAIAARLEKGGYVQLSADGLACGRGYYWMAADQLVRYRRAVAEDRTGKELEALVAAAAKRSIGITGHEQLKTAPRGYPKDHPRVDLLRNKGLVAWQEWPPAAWLGTRKAKDRVIAFLHATDPLAEWLDAHVGESNA
jgi:uncharacterized protein (TIGR02453 family)